MVENPLKVRIDLLSLPSSFAFLTPISLQIFHVSPRFLPPSPALFLIDPADIPLVP